MKHKFIYLWFLITEKLKDKFGFVIKHTLCYNERSYYENHVFLETMQCILENTDVTDRLQLFTS